MIKPSNLRRPDRGRGFTLPEMLVVIAIIAILAAILVPVVLSALTGAREAVIALEVGNLTAAISQYKNEIGEYPPNFSTAAPANQHLRAKFGRYNPATATVVPPMAGLDAAEVLVFWLQGFSENDKDPLAGTRSPFFAFDESRLVDADGDGYHEYVPRHGLGVPYVYFRSDAYAAAMFNGAGMGTCKPYTKSISPGGFVNPQSFQLFSAGLDGDWGANSANKQFPSGANYAPADRDNIANFSEGTLGDKAD